MTEIIIQSLARSYDNAVNEAVYKAASLCRYLDDIDFNNHSDPLFRSCIEAVELGQSVKVRMGENRAKYDKIKKRLERYHRVEQSNSNQSTGQEKD
jgi:hypothetical protein